MSGLDKAQELLRIAKTILNDLEDGLKRILIKDVFTFKRAYSALLIAFAFSIDAYSTFKLNRRAKNHQERLRALEELGMNDYRELYMKILTRIYQSIPDNYFVIEDFRNHLNSVKSYIDLVDKELKM
ncbi:MAG: hypothetical protein B6V02_02530 [Thermoprotei archaeon ex4572_64]|nr:MAG: hypothetical protein B6V02_02530 [Thermoprotei archaeon ex4572_64]